MNKIFELPEGGFNSTEKLRLLPVHVVAVSGGIVLKRGRLELRISGEEAGIVVQVISEETAGDGGTVNDICNRFARPDRQLVADLLYNLLERRLLVSADNEKVEQPETSEQIYYWHFNREVSEVRKTLGDIQIAVLGVNFITRQLVHTLKASGFSQITVYDIPELRNIRMFNEEGQLLTDQWPDDNGFTRLESLDEQAIGSLQPDCLIASSDYGSQDALRKWNQFCIERKINFLPVVLKDLIGQVGPLVISGETACLECFRLRQNSHFDNPESHRNVDRESSSSQWVTGFHPAMASILGDVAIMELTKFYSMTPKWHVGSAIEVNLLTSTMKPRRILKLPGCPVCSKLHQRSSTTASQFVFLPGNRV